MDKLYIIDNIMVAVGFVAVMAATLVYGLWSLASADKGTEWWHNEYGRMVVLRDIALAGLLYKNFTSVVHGKLSHDPGYEWLNIIIGVMMAYQLVVTIRMVRKGAEIARYHSARKALESEDSQ